MEITVLGPFGATLGDRSVTPTAAKPRQVLALLALQTREVVSVPALVEELWGENPPRSALTTLQTYVLHLRRLIGAALIERGGGCAKDVLRTRFGGYLLDIDPDHVDAHRFERIATAGERAFDLGDNESAARLLRSALDLWRGGALADVAQGMPLDIEVTRLQERRLGIVETRIDADLRLGRHHALVAELSGLVARHPMHENLRARYMIALYRSGRQWQALDTYADLRDTLVVELALEPSGRLQHLQHLMLSSDVTLDRACAQELEKLLA
ncbi:MAG: AfsR/SARP family transcriptional regulator [Pseudonocardia sp.]|nr:AfsR/SARP family transcriptional regulator [Pseudonocardia sp.]